MVNIIGAGGHSRSLVSLVERCNISITGIFDNNFVDGEVIMGYPLLGTINQLPNDSKVVLAVGNNNLRSELFEHFANNILESNLIDPKAIVHRAIRLGIGNQIFSGVIINSLATIGYNNIINTGAIIEHESVIGNNNHISIGAILSGRVTVGNNCFIGAGSVLIDNISICNNVTIGANSVVVKNILEPGTYVGNPVRRIK